MSQALQLSIKWWYMVWHPSFINLFFNSVNCQLSTRFFFFFFQNVSNYFSPDSVWNGTVIIEIKGKTPTQMFRKLQNDRKYVSSEEIWEPVRTHTIFAVYIPVMFFLYLCLAKLVCSCFIKFQYKEGWGMQSKSCLQNSLLFCIYVGLLTLLYSHYSLSWQQLYRESQPQTVDRVNHAFTVIGTVKTPMKNQAHVRSACFFKQQFLLLQVFIPKGTCACTH